MDGAAPARGTLSAKKSSHIPINDPLDQKCSIHSQPIAKANSESSKPNKVHLEILANQILSIFLFLILYPKNSFLPFALFCSYPQRSCPLHEVLNTAFDSTKLFFKYIYIYIATQCSMWDSSSWSRDQMSQIFTSGGQRFGVSASASVLPINIQNWFPLGWTGWISL